MKTNFRMTGKDVSNYNINMRWIRESMHGDPIPPNLLSMYDLSRPLSGKEISDICNSARMINKSNGYKKEFVNSSSHESISLGPIASSLLCIFLGGYLTYGAFEMSEIVFGLIGVFLFVGGICSLINFIKPRK